MSLWLMITAAIGLGLIVALWVARTLHARALCEAISTIKRGACEAPHPQVDSVSMDALPAPVQRYLNHALPPDHHCLKLVRYEQTGSLRTSTDSDKWLAFTATQFISPGAVEFLWIARVAVAPLVHLQIRDSLINGIGSGQVVLLSTVPVASAAGNMEMNSGALHRFLGEAVWYPTALLPSKKLSWAPIDDSTALATLSSGTATVSLEFRFNSENEVVGIYTPGRWGTFDGKYRQAAWEGKFRKYIRREGVLVPSEGEVGWYSDGQWRSVWRGSIVAAELEFR